MQTVSRDNVADLYRAAFAQIHDPADWKAPIDCVVPYELANIYVQAIEFMVGVKPNAEAVRDDVIGRAFRLTCVGYRAGPCGG